MRPLRVELVSEHASPLAAVGEADAGGQNVHVSALAGHLAALGCEVTVATRADDPALPARLVMEPGVTVHHVPAGPPRPVPKDGLWQHMPEFARQLRRRWTADPPDLVHAHFWMSGWAALRARRGMDGPPPVVQTFHALGVVKRRHQGAADTSPPERSGVEAQLVRAADHVIATCRDEVAELTALGGRPDDMSVVPCGIDPELFRPGGPAAARSLSSGLRHRIVVVSRLVPRKGIDDVIAALSLLPDTELVVAGGPPAAALDQDAEACRLARLARSFGVALRVRFLGAVPRPDVPALLRSADLVACVPWYEPFGIVPLEAMACGTPVVGTAVGGLLDSVDDHRTGVLVPPHDPWALAQAASHLLANPSLRARMGEEAAARVRQHFTWPQVAHSTLEIYRRFVSEDRSAAARTGGDWAVPA
jgi:glycosyltransferase involved in cell wall biosynthesis